MSKRKAFNYVIFISLRLRSTLNARPFGIVHLWGILRIPIPVVNSISTVPLVHPGSSADPYHSQPPPNELVNFRVLVLMHRTGASGAGAGIVGTVGAEVGAPRAVPVGPPRGPPPRGHPGRSRHSHRPRPSPSESLESGAFPPRPGEAVLGRP